MTLLEIGRTGASKQSWRSGPRALLKTLLDKAKNPHNGKVLFTQFLEAALPSGVREAFENEDEERRLVNIIEYWFTNNYNSMIHLYPRPGEEKQHAAELKARAANREKRKERMREIVRERIHEKAEILLLEWVAPNGKLIGDCTGKEIRQFGRKIPPWLGKIASRVKPTEIVRDVLNNDELREMWGK